MKENVSRIKHVFASRASDPNDCNFIYCSFCRSSKFKGRNGYTACKDGTKLADTEEAKLAKSSKEVIDSYIFLYEEKYYQVY